MNFAYLVMTLRFVRGSYEVFRRAIDREANNGANAPQNYNSEHSHASRPMKLPHAFVL